MRAVAVALLLLAPAVAAGTVEDSRSDVALFVDRGDAADVALPAVDILSVSVETVGEDHVATIAFVDLRPVEEASDNVRFRAEAQFITAEGGKVLLDLFVRPDGSLAVQGMDSDRGYTSIPTSAVHDADADTVTFTLLSSIHRGGVTWVGARAALWNCVEGSCERSLGGGPSGQGILGFYDEAGSAEREATRIGL